MGAKERLPRSSTLSPPLSHTCGDCKGQAKHLQFALQPQRWLEVVDETDSFEEESFKEVLPRYYPGVIVDW